jgi:Phytanoyl-CoA dioxygenase (PhyH)
MSVLAAQELVDSSSLLGDPEALRARVADEGYVFFRGLLDPVGIRSVGAEVLGQLQAAGWTEGGYDPVMARPVLPVRAVRMADLLGDPIYTRIVLDPRLNKLAYRSRLADVMRDLLGPLGFCYPLRIPRIVYPTHLAPRQPGNYVHKDYRSVQDMFTCWIPFGEIPRGLGGLALLPGSQTTDRVTPHPLGQLSSGWLTTDYEPGDALVFHCLTSHAALPNLTDRMRFSVEYRWQLADQPAPRRLVIGPTGVEIGSRFLSRHAWWKPMPAGLQLFDEDLDGTRSRLPAPPSRFVRFP